MKRVLAVLLALMLVPTAGALLASADATQVDRSENVTLYVTAFVSNYEGDGVRSDPVSKYIEQSLNITLDLTGANEADYPTQLSAMMASNDLPDIFYLSDITKQLPMLIESQQILPLEELYDQYAVNMTNDPTYQAARILHQANNSEGHLYTIGLCHGQWADVTQPTCGDYIRWDLYAQAGYPEITDLDSLLEAIDAMVKLEPETADGQKTYGMGAWFGDSQGWGDWVITYGNGPEIGQDLMLSSARTVAIDCANGVPIDQNQMTDPESAFWQIVGFYNKANQLGLLDPDSFTQKSDVYEEKLKAGRYMFCHPGWMAGNANSEFKKTAGNVKTFVSLPSFTGSDTRMASMVYGERSYCVSAATQYPERCMDLMDFVSTKDFSFTQYNGLPEGGLWTAVDGKQVPTEEYLASERNDEFSLKTGTNVYHHFMGYGNGTLMDNSVPVDLYQYSEAAWAKKMNATYQDFLNHYGATTFYDAYSSVQTNMDSMNFYTLSEAPNDLKTYISGLDAYIYKTLFSVIAAPTDADFQAQRDAMIAGMAEYRVDDIYNYFYNDCLNQQETVKSIVDILK